MLYSTNMYQLFPFFPVVPKRAVAEVSKIGDNRREVSCCDAWIAERIH